MVAQASGREGARLWVIGAGLAGLSAAVHGSSLGRPVTLMEAARHAGGRCRSFEDTGLGRRIDNGNHLILGGNEAVFEYLGLLGAGDALAPLEPAAFPFAEPATGRHWTLRPSRGRLAWWLLRPARRVPDSRLSDYLPMGRLVRAPLEATVAQCLDPARPLFQRFWRPLTLAILNTEPEAASAALLGRVLSATLLKGADASRPFLAPKGLSTALVDPALAHLDEQGVDLAFATRLKGLETTDGRVTALRFAGGPVSVADGDKVILALPPHALSEVAPGLAPEFNYHAIVNAHFRIEGAPGLADDSPFLGLIGATGQWIFRRGDVFSVTVSAADALARQPPETIAATLWEELRGLLDRPPGTPPPYRIIKEKRATIAQTPGQNALRPGAATRLANLFLAGDWTGTGLPATIEGAIRSGRHAARLAVESEKS